jgi:hypothetical protein
LGTIALACALAENTVLHIAVVSGEGAVHAAGSHPAKPLTVEVTDETGKPVEGARVSFQLPEEGPGGVFTNGLRTDLAVTDATGRAAVHGFQLNRTPGPFAIRVTAVKEQARAGFVARQHVGGAKTAETAPTESADRKAPVPARIVKVAVAQPTPKPPGQPAAGPGQDEARPARIPTVIITQRNPGRGSNPSVHTGHKSHKKWVILGLVAGGAAGAYAGRNLGVTAHGSQPAPGVAGSTASVSISTPTITIGKP